MKNCILAQQDTDFFHNHIHFLSGLLAEFESVEVKEQFINDKKKIGWQFLYDSRQNDNSR